MASGEPASSLLLRPDRPLPRAGAARVLLAAREAARRAGGFRRVTVELGRGPRSRRDSARGALKLGLAAGSERKAAPALVAELERLARAAQERPLRAAGAGAPLAGPGPVLLFRNALGEPGKEPPGAAHQGALVVGSALAAAGAAPRWTDLKVAAPDPEELARAEAAAGAVGLVGLTLYDAYFEQARRVLGRLRAAGDAYVVVGGSMPTLSPVETFVHAPEADFVARGAGEKTAPALARALEGRGRSRGLRPDQLERLLALEGVIFEAGGVFGWAGAERAPASEPDQTPLDFSLLEPRHLAAGLQLCLSRGCRYACHFCTSLDRGRYRGPSPRRLADRLAALARALMKAFGSWAAVPPAAFGVGFYDDDFMTEPGRAAQLLDVVRRSPFHARFVQTAVASLGSPEALGALAPEAFRPKRFAQGGAGPQVYLGTESFCDAELERLGKRHRAADAERAARELSRRGFAQAHHFIATNAQTRPEDLVESLGRIARLSRECAPHFRVLEPVIPRLTSFYKTASRRRLERAGLAAQARERGRLSAAGYPEFDYPLAAGDEPLDGTARRFARRVEGRTGLDWDAELAWLRAQEGQR